MAQPGIASSSVSPARRHDVDWLRTIAIGLLIVYHSAIAYQPWGALLGYAVNDEPVEALWVVMSALNAWRIPLLFVISGMGMRFAMQRRDWKALLKDRVQRILVPYLFGTVTVASLMYWFVARYYHIEYVYVVNHAHLWFLANIFAYVLILLLPMMMLKNRPDNNLFRLIHWLLKKPATLYLAAVPLVIETLIVPLPPEGFTTYYDNLHGFALGMVCFGLGFLFAAAGEDFWRAVRRIWISALPLAIMLYLVRFFLFILSGEVGLNALTAIESTCWMLAVFSLGARLLNKPSKGLTYLRSAAYPVYIIHLPVQYGLALLILPLDIVPLLEWVLLVLATVSVSMAIYEVLLRRINLIRPLFGMKRIRKPMPTVSAD